MNNKTLTIFSLISTILAIIAYGLTYTILGIYSLISSILFGIISLGFIATIEKKEKTNQTKILKILSYVILLIGIITFIIGIIYASNIS